MRTFARLLILMTMTGGLIIVFPAGGATLANSALPAEARSTLAATPTPEPTPQTRVFIPAVGESQQAREQTGVLMRIQAWLDEGYRGFLLLLLALAALAFLKWRPGEKDGSDSH